MLMASAINHAAAVTTTGAANGLALRANGDAAEGAAVCECEEGLGHCVAFGLVYATFGCRPTRGLAWTSPWEVVTGECE